MWDSCSHFWMFYWWDRFWYSMCTSQDIFHFINGINTVYIHRHLAVTVGIFYQSWKTFSSWYLLQINLTILCISSLLSQVAVAKSCIDSLLTFVRTHWDGRSVSIPALGKEFLPSEFTAHHTDTHLNIISITLLLIYTLGQEWATFPLTESLVNIQQV